MPANTTPDGIVYPINSDDIAPLETHFQDLADSVQTALTGSGKYRYGGRVQYTASDSFTKASYPGLRAISVRVQGGGGGSGGCAATGSSQFSLGGSGGGGGYAERFITDIAGLAASETVTVGAGGTAGTSGPGDGGTGGSSIAFGITCNGGTGGGAGSAVSAITGVPGTSGSGGGVSGTVDQASNGGDGIQGFALDQQRIYVGAGGGSRMAELKSRSIVGGGGAPGGGGQKYGGGAYGPCNSQSLAARAGAAGGSGIVVVDLFY